MSVREKGETGAERNRGMEACTRMGIFILSRRLVMSFSVKVNTIIKC